MTNIAEIPVHTGNDLLFSMVFIPAYSYVKKKRAEEEAQIWTSTQTVQWFYKGSIDLRA
jgi:hypothetical protein